MEEKKNIKIRYISPVVWTVIVVARINVKLFGVEMEDNINDVLVSPYYFAFILMIYGNDIFFPTKVPHSCQIHQHHSRINT